MEGIIEIAHADTRKPHYLRRMDIYGDMVETTFKDMARRMEEARAKDVMKAIATKGIKDIKGLKFVLI